MSETKPDSDREPVDDQTVGAVEETAAEPDPTTAEPADEMSAVIAERDANYERWMRSEAELANYRKRVQREREEAALFQALPLVRDLLPPMDNLQRAIDAANVSQNLEELIEGVRLVAKQFEDVLARHATQPIVAIGEPFDPNHHEAVQQMPSADHPPMTVIEEVERGYILNERVVRPSKVIVSSGPPPEMSGDSE